MPALPSSRFLAWIIGREILKVLSYTYEALYVINIMLPNSLYGVPYTFESSA